MPDMPQGAPQGAPAPGGSGGGGGITEAIQSVDQTLTKIVGAAGQSQQLPDAVKKAAQAALDAFRQFEQALMQAAGGSGGDQEPDEDDQGGTTTPEQGASGAVPVSHQNMRG